MKTDTEIISFLIWGIWPLTVLRMKYLVCTELSFQTFYHFINRITVTSNHLCIHVSLKELSALPPVLSQAGDL